MSAPYALDPSRPTQLGLVVLQADETIEQDMRALLPLDIEYLVSRVRSGTSVTPDSLRDMESNLTAAAALLPQGARMACVGYACTSGTAEIGAERIRELVSTGAETAHVTDPVTALMAACRHLRIKRLGLLSPYVAEVSDKLRAVLEQSGIEVVAFSSFDEPFEERVVRISNGSVIAAARKLAQSAKADALFLSCTNLRTLKAIPQLEADLGIPVLSSNLVLAWHMAHLANTQLAPDLPYRLVAPVTK